MTAGQTADPRAGSPEQGSDESAWIQCTACQAIVYRERLLRCRQVCPRCGHHGPLTARQRLEFLLDPGSICMTDAPARHNDPLGFVDRLPYVDRLAKACADTGMDEAVICATGTVLGRRVVVASMDFRFMGGSLGRDVGERITAAAEYALGERIPLLIVTASGGARMQEGALALMQMAKASQALAALDEAGVLTISVISEPTYGGVAASFATASDLIFAEPGAHLGFAGPRVIEQTTRQALPPGLQTAEFLLEHGLIDDIQPRGSLRTALASALDLHQANRAAPRNTPRLPALDRVVDIRTSTEHSDEGRPASPLITDADALADPDPWEVVQLARRTDRPTTLDYTASVLDDFHELHGDRATGDCPAVVAGIGRIDGRTLVLVGHEKGHTTRERIARNFGMSSPAGHRKAARVMRLAGKLGVPVLTFIDTPGAHPGVDAETRGQAVTIAENLRLMSCLPVPIVCVLIGEGGSGGALALGVGDQMYALSGAYLSVISPEGCGAILWRDSAAAPRAAAALRLDSKALLRHGIVDAVIPEPTGGAHQDPDAMAVLVRQAVEQALDDLTATDPRQLVAYRRKRLRSY